MVKAAEVPKTYEELLSARWKGSNISIDQDGYEFLQGLVLTWGKEKAVGFLKRLAAQNPTPRRGNSLRVQLVVAGEYPLLITMASPVQLARREGAPIQWIPLEPVPVSFHAIALAERAAHPNAGKLYIDFILSREGQEALAACKGFRCRNVEADPPNRSKVMTASCCGPWKKKSLTKSSSSINRSSIFGKEKQCFGREINAEFI